MLRRLLIEDDNGVSVIDFLISVDMKVVVQLFAESWNDIESSTLCKIIPMHQTNQSKEVTGK